MLFDILETLKEESLKVKSMQRPGNEDAIRTQIQPSKPQRESNKKIQISKIQREHMVNWVGSFFPKGGHSVTQPELKTM